MLALPTAPPPSPVLLDILFPARGPPNEQKGAPGSSREEAPYTQDSSSPAFPLLWIPQKTHLHEVPSCPPTHPPPSPTHSKSSFTSHLVAVRRAEIGWEEGRQPVNPGLGDRPHPGMPVLLPPPTPSQLGSLGSWLSKRLLCRTGSGFDKPIKKARQGLVLMILLDASGSLMACVTTLLAEAADKPCRAGGQGGVRQKWGRTSWSESEGPWARCLRLGRPGSK